MRSLLNSLLPKYCLARWPSRSMLAEDRLMSTACPTMATKNPTERKTAPSSNSVWYWLKATISLPVNPRMSSESPTLAAKTAKLEIEAPAVQMRTEKQRNTIKLYSTKWRKMRKSMLQHFFRRTIPSATTMSGTVCWRGGEGGAGGGLRGGLVEEGGRFRWGALLNF